MVKVDTAGMMIQLQQQQSQGADTAGQVAKRHNNIHW